MKVLLAYATRKGSTQETSQFIGERMRTHGLDVTVADCDDMLSVQEYDAVIIGTGIYRGMWLPAAETFLRKFGTTLATKPLYVFVQCIRALEEDGRDHALSQYMPKHLLVHQKLVDVGVFAGRLNTSDIDWHERWTLSVRYDGSIDHSQAIDKDYRDWDSIGAWADKVAQNLATS